MVARVERRYRGQVHWLDDRGLDSRRSGVQHRDWATQSEELEETLVCETHLDTWNAVQLLSTDRGAYAVVDLETLPSHLKKSQ